MNQTDVLELQSRLLMVLSGFVYQYERIDWPNRTPESDEMYYHARYEIIETYADMQELESA